MRPALARLPMRAQAHGTSSAARPATAPTTSTSTRPRSRPAWAAMRTSTRETTSARRTTPLWQEEVAGQRPRGPGVSCAGLPHAARNRQGKGRRRARPAQPERQPAAEREDDPHASARTVTASGSRIDALADPALVRQQFQRRPARTSRASTGSRGGIERTTARPIAIQRSTKGATDETALTRSLTLLALAAFPGHARQSPRVPAGERPAADGRRAARGHGIGPHRVHASTSSTACRTKTRSSRPASTGRTTRRCRCRRRCSAWARRWSGKRRGLHLLAAFACGPSTSRTRRRRM